MASDKKFEWLTKQQSGMWIGGGALLAAATSALAVAKRMALGNTALDLAIFHQTVANTAAGRWFALSIHPHSYFGDHFSPLLAAVAGVYRLLPHVDTLLVLQCLAVASAVLPLMILARRLRGSWQIAVLAAFLFSPLVHNAALFEFEFLVFSLPVLLWALLAYERRRLWLFLSLVGLTALIREDLGLVLIGFSLLALADRRPWQWAAIPTLAGAALISIALMVSGSINGEQYKFFSYFGWLGATPAAAVSAAVSQPWRVALQVIRPQNVLFLVSLFLVFAGLPLLRLRRLLPALPAVLALLLTSFGGDSIALRTHYPVVFLPFLFWSAIGGLDRLEKRPPGRLHRLIEQPAGLGALLLVVTAVYGWLTMSPLRPTGVAATATDLRDPRLRAAAALVQTMPSDAAVAAGYRFLPGLAARERLYSLNYIFSGRRQFSSQPYTLPQPVDVILYDAADALFYSAQYGKDPKRYAAGDDRLRTAIAESGLRLTRLLDTFLVYDNTGAGEPPLLTTEAAGRPAPANRGIFTLAAIGGQNEQLRTDPVTIGQTSVATMPVTLTWVLGVPTEKNALLRVEYRDESDRIIAARSYPLGYGIQPTSEWEVGAPVSVRFRWILPALGAGTYRVLVQAEDREGFLTLDQKLTAEFETTRRTAMSESAEIGRLVLTEPVR